MARVGHPIVPNPIRDAAIAAGDLFYQPDHPCPNGHTCVRRTSTRHCVDCVTEGRRRHYNLHAEQINETARTKRAVAWGDKPRKNKPGPKPQEGKLPRKSHHPLVYCYPKPLPRALQPRVPRIKIARVGFFIEKADLFDAVIESQTKGKVTERLGEMLILLSKRYFMRQNWSGYSFVDEMRDEAVLVMFGAVFKFDAAKSHNPFAYMTSVMKNVALHMLKKHKQDQSALYEERVIAEIDLEEEAIGSNSRNRGFRQQ